MDTTRVMFFYLGRRGGLPQFTLEVADAALADKHLSTTVCISRQNEIYNAFTRFGSSLMTVDTFTATTGALTGAWRIPTIRRQLHQRIQDDRTQLVIELMAHPWSAMLAPAIRKAGAQYCTIVHDAVAHPGDHRALIKPLIDRALRAADLIITLSETVADQLVKDGKAKSDKILTLFHPDFNYGPHSTRQIWTGNRPLRLLFLGRIMKYKGLGMFLDAVERLRADGHTIEFGVFGEGALGDDEARIRRLDGELINRWLSNDEIASILARFDVVVLSHTEASQSGIAAAAHGAGLPVVATPVGGLVKQIVDGKNGVLARSPDAPALADAVKRLLDDPVQYTALTQQLKKTQADRSVQRFVNDCVSGVLKHRSIIENHSDPTT